MTEKWNHKDALRRHVADRLKSFSEPKKPSSLHERDGYEIRVFRGGFGRYGYDSDGIKTRRVDFEVSRDGDLVGRLWATEWKVDPEECTPRDFYTYADEESADAGEFALHLKLYWGDDDWPAMAGNMVQIDDLVIDSARDTGRKAMAVIGWCLQNEFSKRCSIMMAQAVPLEFRVDRRIEVDEVKRQRRSLAMYRHYHGLTGLSLFGGQPSTGGWMWKVMNASCPIPQDEPSAVKGRLVNGRLYLE